MTRIIRDVKGIWQTIEGILSTIKVQGRYSSMEHPIGSKIKATRIEKTLTEEQAAELLGVSRQTISNWENEKSYPDIISVKQISECYEVSLDYLLKAEQKTKTYYDSLKKARMLRKATPIETTILQFSPIC